MMNLVRIRKTIVALLCLSLVAFAVVGCNKKLSVSYYIDGELYSSISIKAGDDIELLQPEEKVGLTFDGWYTESDCSGEKVVEISIDSNISLYGRYVQSVYSVYYPENRDGYTIELEEGQSADVKHGETFRFRVVAADEYDISAITVTANGQAITAGDDGYYELVVTQAVIVAVSGVKAVEYAVSGSVVDQLSMPIASREITLLNKTNPAQSKVVTTDASGNFSANLSRGEYIVRTRNYADSAVITISGASTDNDVALSYMYLGGSAMLGTTDIQSQANEGVTFVYGEGEQAVEFINPSTTITGDRKPQYFSDFVSDGDVLIKTRVSTDRGTIGNASGALANNSSFGIVVNNGSVTRGITFYQNGYRIHNDSLAILGAEMGAAGMTDFSFATSAARTNFTVDIAIVRKAGLLSNTYYMFLKETDETDYQLFYAYEDTEVMGESAFGLVWITAYGYNNTAKYEQYSISDNATEIAAFFSDYTVRVNDGSNPFNGAFVVATIKHDSKESAINEEIITGADGVATFNLPKGTYEFTISADEYPSMVEELGENGGDIAVSLRKRAMTQGTVTDANGAVADAVVTVSGNGIVPQTATTDVDGKFSIEVASADDEYTFVVVSGDYVTTSGTKIIKDTQTEEENTIDFVLVKKVLGGSVMLGDSKITSAYSNELMTMTNGGTANESIQIENKVTTGVTAWNNPLYFADFASTGDVVVKTRVFTDRGTGNANGHADNSSFGIVINNGTVIRGITFFQNGYRIQNDTMGELTGKCDGAAGMTNFTFQTSSTRPNFMVDIAIVRKVGLLSNTYYMFLKETDETDYQLFYVYEDSEVMGNSVFGLVWVTALARNNIVKFENYSVSDNATDIAAFFADYTITVNNGSDEIEGATVSATLKVDAGRTSMVSASNNTNATGVVIFTLPKGTYSFTVSATDYPTMLEEIGHSGGNKTVSLRKSITAQGTVTDSNGAVAGATVTVSGNGIAPQVAVTDASGEYTITVPSCEDAYTFTVTAGEYFTQTVTNVIKEGQTEEENTVDFVLDKKVLGGSVTVGSSTIHSQSNDGVIFGSGDSGEYVEFTNATTTVTGDRKIQYFTDVVLDGDMVVKARVSTDRGTIGNASGTLANNSSFGIVVNNGTVIRGITFYQNGYRIHNDSLVIMGEPKGSAGMTDFTFQTSTARPNFTVDIAIVRKAGLLSNTYYMFLKETDETDYQLFYIYEDSEVMGASAFGLVWITASAHNNTAKYENYSISSNATDIAAFFDDYTITVKDESDASFENATVTAKLKTTKTSIISEEKTTNASGEAIFALPSGMYIFTVSATDYPDMSKELSFGGSTTVTMLNSIAAQGTITDANGVVSGVTVTVSGNGITAQTATTNANGEYTVNVPSSENAYTFTVVETGDYIAQTTTKVIKHDNSVAENTVDFVLSKRVVGGSVAVNGKTVSSLIVNDRMTMTNGGTTDESIYTWNNATLQTNAGWGKPLYFTDFSSETVMVKTRITASAAQGEGVNPANNSAYGFVINDGTNSFALTLLGAGERAYPNPTATTSAEKATSWLLGGRSHMVNFTSGATNSVYQAANPSLENKATHYVYDIMMIRQGTDYYLFIKYVHETKYVLRETFSVDKVSGTAAYGLIWYSAVASNTYKSDCGFSHYSITSDAGEIATAMAGVYTINDANGGTIGIAGKNPTNGAVALVDGSNELVNTKTAGYYFRQDTAQFAFASDVTVTFTADSGKALDKVVINGTEYALTATGESSYTIDLDPLGDGDVYTITQAGQAYVLTIAAADSLANELAVFSAVYTDVT